MQCFIHGLISSCVSRQSSSGFRTAVTCAPPRSDPTDKQRVRMEWAGPHVCVRLFLSQDLQLSHAVMHSHANVAVCQLVV